MVFTMRGNGSLGYWSHRPAILPPADVTTNIKVLKKNVLKCLRVSKFMDIVLLIPATIPQVIGEVLKLMVGGLLRPFTLSQVIL